VTHQEAVETLATERYLLDEMSDVDRAGFEEHYFSCDVCAQDVKTADALREGVRDVFRGERARRKTIVPWYRSQVVPWAMAASLAGIVVYQSFMPGANVRTESSTRVLHPVTLRPDSRGQEAVIASPSPADGITLALEINGVREGTDMAYDLRNAAGRSVASGHVAAPAAGIPLLLWLSPGAVADPARYVLSFSDAAGQPLGEYRFVHSK